MGVLSTGIVITLALSTPLVVDGSRGRCAEGIEDVEDHGIGHALSYPPRSVADGTGAVLALAPRKETLMTAEDDLLGIVGKVLIDIEDIKGHFPRTIAKQKNDTAAGAGDFEFRPLTAQTPTVIKAGGPVVFTDRSGPVIR